MLPRLQQRLRIPLKILVVGESAAEVYPQATLQRAYALRDASRIAPAFGLDFAAQAQQAKPEARLIAARHLLDATSVDEFCRQETALATTLFSGHIPAITDTVRPHADTFAVLAAHARRRAALGNYLPAMWQLNGQWYWGVDRLAALESDLRAGAWLDGDEPLVDFDPSRARLPSLQTGADLEFFYSFRSPYSYLAVEALASRISDLPVPLQIRPVLPMAMRGMKIPRTKGLYIARDAAREARRQQIPFGRIADPLGHATERCLTLFNLLTDSREQLGFLRSCGRAVWSQGIDVATDAGLRMVWERAGLDWSTAAARLASGMDLAQAETNRRALFEAGCWGVPSFRLGDLITWGNDRLWMIDEVLRRQAEAQT